MELEQAVKDVISNGAHKVVYEEACRMLEEECSKLRKALTAVVEGLGPEVVKVTTESVPRRSHLEYRVSISVPQWADAAVVALGLDPDSYWIDRQLSAKPAPVVASAAKLLGHYLSVDPNLLPNVFYVTGPGESLVGIAARELGDPSLWPLIRDLNALKWPGMRQSDYYPVGSQIKMPGQYLCKNAKT